MQMSTLPAKITISNPCITHTYKLFLSQNCTVIKLKIISALPLHLLLPSDVCHSAKTKNKEKKGKEEKFTARNNSMIIIINSNDGAADTEFE